MFKVISAEIKKMLSKPGIYILAVLLAIILILGAFIYHPTVYEDTTISLNGNDFMVKYSSFENGNKVEADKLVDNTTSNILSYTIVEDAKTLTYKEKITNLKSTFDMWLEDYRSSQQSSLGSDKITEYKNNVVNALKDLKDAVTKGVENSKLENAFTILTTEENYTLFIDTINDAMAQMDVDVDKDSNGVAGVCKIYDDKYKKIINGCLNSLIYPTLSEEILSKYNSTEENSRLTIIKSRLAAISDKITSLHDEVVKDETGKLSYQKSYIDNLEKYANQYINVCKDYGNLVRYELLSNAFSFVSATDELKLYYFKSNDYTSYNIKTNLMKYNYLFEQNKTDYDFAHPLTIGVASNHEINAYDYAYFSLKLFSFVIIVYAVMSACNCIAGEIKEGSMRYYAIRPVSRTNIYLGKILSIIIMSAILIVFSTIIALAVGGAVYGFDSLNILTIFNSSTIVTFHPIVMIIIFALSLLAELIVYTSIAMLLSCLFKSDLLAVTLMLVLYLVNTLLPVFVRGANSWITFYPFSHISLYALFGSSIYAIKNDFLNRLLGAKIYVGSSLLVYLIVVLAIVLITNIIAIVRFKKKEL